MLAPGIGIEFQWPLRGNARIFLTQAAGCRIARVHIEFAPCLCLLCVQRSKVGIGHIDLAANFDAIRPSRPRQLIRNIIQRAGIGRNIFTDTAVAARCRLDQTAVFVGQAEGQAINLGLCRDHQFFVRGQTQKATNAIRKILDVLVRERIVER